MNGQHAPSSAVICQKREDGEMKKLAAAIATSLFAAGVSAADMYQGFAKGNPDLRSGSVDVIGISGIQPGVGDSIDRYHGWADGNPDLFRADPSGTTNSGNAPDIYMSISGNPDLQF